MFVEEFDSILAELALSKSQVAKLLGVSLRAVNLWVAGDREIPGPTAAYLRLLARIPAAQRMDEIARLHLGERKMYDGLYLIEYEAAEGAGYAVLVFMDGYIFGHDSQVVYDGVYAPHASDYNFMDVRLELTVPAGVALVMGVPAQPAEYRFPIETVIPARGGTNLNIKTPYGPVVCSIKFLRGIPRALAA